MPIMHIDARCPTGLNANPIWCPGVLPTSCPPHHCDGSNNTCRIIFFLHWHFPKHFSNIKTQPNHNALKKPTHNPQENQYYKQLKSNHIEPRNIGYQKCGKAEMFSLVLKKTRRESQMMPCRRGSHIPWCHNLQRIAHLYILASHIFDHSREEIRCILASSNHLGAGEAATG